MRHEQIWAPWRLGYITGNLDEVDALEAELQFPAGADRDCFLCQAVASRADRQRHVVRRGEHTITILNRYPYNNGHLLIAPRCHRGRLDELDAAVHLACAEELCRMTRLLERVLRPEGFNVGLNLGKVAGAGLPGHLHWHIVPRWNGDTNFMPTLAAVKVIPQALDALWEALTEELASLP
ncbi:MAG: HIT domain-containing protein [Pirellulales bacterium]|nr:HIT domain-containing protein [Pirellulales bacterium]